MFFNKIFKRKVEPVNNEIQEENREEVLLVAKSKYNKHGNQLREKLNRHLREVSQTTSIRFKKVTIQTRIGEYDNLSFELITGILYQLNHKLQGEELFIGEIVIKAKGEMVDIQMNYLNGKSLHYFIDRKFRTSFGVWGVYQAQGISLAASFNKNKYREFVMGQRTNTQPGRENHA